MHDWNTVASLQGREYGKGVRLLERFGVVEPTPFYNVVVLRAEAPAELLPALDALAEEEPQAARHLALVSPIQLGFPFQEPEEFHLRCQEAVPQLLPRLVGRPFFVRFHRRGFKGRLRSPDEEQRLAGWLLDGLEAAGSPGRIAFDAAQAVVVVESVGTRAGLAVWTREELDRHRFLNIS